MMDIYLGIDLGGTKIAATILKPESGERAGQTIIPTDAHEGPDAVLKRIAMVARKVCASAGVSLDSAGGVGVGVPAVIDGAGECTILMPNLPGDWNGKPVARILQEYLDRPVVLVNDARSFTLAEATLGAGRGARVVACFTLGTGIGGGIAIDGNLLWGVDGTAGEFGHITIDINGPLCGCGNRGCLEALASGPAITAMAVKAVLQGVTTKIRDLANGDIRQVNPHTIMQAAETGDTVALEILERAGDYLGAGIANVLTTVSPDRIVIGGGVAQLGESILRPTRAALQRRCRAVPLDKIEIVRAALGDEAGMIGAALLASQKVAQK